MQAGCNKKPIRVKTAYFILFFLVFPKRTQKSETFKKIMSDESGCIKGTLSHTPWDRKHVVNPGALSSGRVGSWRGWSSALSSGGSPGSPQEGESQRLRPLFPVGQDLHIGVQPCYANDSASHTPKKEKLKH